MGFLDELKKGVLTDLVQRFSAAIPKIALALFILLIGRLIALAARKLTKRVLNGLHIDRLAEQLNDIDIVQRSVSMAQVTFASLRRIKSSTTVSPMARKSMLMHKSLARVLIRITETVVAVYGLIAPVCARIPRPAGSCVS